MTTFHGTAQLPLEAIINGVMRNTSRVARGRLLAQHARIVCYSVSRVASLAELPAGRLARRERVRVVFFGAGSDCSSDVTCGALSGSGEPVGAVCSVLPVPPADALVTVGASSLWSSPCCASCA